MHPCCDRQGGKAHLGRQEGRAVVDPRQRERTAARALRHRYGTGGEGEARGGGSADMFGTMTGNPAKSPIYKPKDFFYRDASPKNPTLF